MKAENGSIIEFLAISWDEPYWEFDHPTLVIKPVVNYSPNGESCVSMIEDMAIDLCCESELKDDEFFQHECEWRGWNIKRIKRVVRERLKGKETWKTKIREVVKQKIQFFEKDNELHYKIIETVKC